jgi:hypothetical protein
MSMSQSYGLESNQDDEYENDDFGHDEPDDAKSVSKSLTDLADLPMPMANKKANAAALRFDDDGFDDWNFDDVE